MRVFKFGGASVKDSAAVKNIAVILKQYSGDLVVVISAMGKTTNALERVLNAYLAGESDRATTELKAVYEYHLQIAGDLIPEPGHDLYSEIENIFAGIRGKLQHLPSANYNQEYDQLVSLGEILSTIIVSNYLNLVGISNQWTDARQFLKTDGTFREGKVDWDISDRLIKQQFDFHKNKIYITQGFIGSTVNNLTTTLGREGSDYTAAILAYVLSADSVTVWKDVPGVLNADPKWFDDTVRLDKISYLDAIELAYYGTSVIHPKTIQPLKNKGIRLYVKSFLHPSDPGTIIGENDYEKLIPSFIFKMDQVLIHIHPVDFSFIAEDNLEKIFRCFAGYGL
jgi:aspartate kinase